MHTPVLAARDSAPTVEPERAWTVDWRDSLTVGRVLVIDDDDDIRDIIVLNLEVAGYEISQASDGRQGLEAAIAEPPDLILLDVLMPRMNGIEVCKEIRQQPALAKTPVILLTSKDQENDIDRGFAAGADDYIVKPFSLRELQSRVLRHCRPADTE